MMLLTPITLAFSLFSPSSVMLHHRVDATMYAVTGDATVTGYRASLEGMAANNILPMIKPSSTDGSLSSYLSNLEGKVSSLCTKYDVPMPQQCNEDACLDVQSYTELLEETLNTLELQWRRPVSSSDWGGSDSGRDEWGGASPDASLTDGSLTSYLARLEAKVDKLTDKLGCAAPTRCVNDACLDLQTYLAMLEETASTLERQWQPQKSATW
jgi:hypothetical protein